MPDEMYAPIYECPPDESPSQNSQRTGSLAAVLKAVRTPESPQQELWEREKAARERERFEQAKAKGYEQRKAAHEQVMEGYKQGDWSMCEEALGGILSLSPRDEAIYCQRSRLRLIQKNVQGAEADAKAAITIAPTSPRGHRHLGLALSTQSRHLEAGERFVESWRLGEEGNEVTRERFDEHMGGLQRERAYTPRREQRGDDHRVGPDAGRLRMRLLSTTPPPNQTRPGQCFPVELAAPPTTHSLTLHLREVAFDGNDEIFRYVLQVHTCMHTHPITQIKLHASPSPTTNLPLPPPDVDGGPPRQTCLPQPLLGCL